ncbi:unnamed protein product [Prorocentrum cordatum]|uniref:Uncharacterized protein n=1 Tax=Prorocentrum cordatum TaxID=2364126 RepID=A0ABN9THX9_9DINO|nr:unnamed protein product [Polarella glacialis]
MRKTRYLPASRQILVNLLVAPDLVAQEEAIKINADRANMFADIPTKEVQLDSVPALFLKTGAVSEGCFFSLPPRAAASGTTATTAWASEGEEGPLRSWERGSCVPLVM